MWSAAISGRTWFEWHGCAAAAAAGRSWRAGLASRPEWNARAPSAKRSSMDGMQSSCLGAAGGGAAHAVVNTKRSLLAGRVNAQPDLWRKDADLGERA
jgi:hypothetical protein